jgi:hypothetical protein
VKRKKQEVVSHRSQVNGFKKTHAFLLLVSLIGTTITKPDSVYGIVKSTYKDLFALIVISPTTASKFCQVIKRFTLIISSAWRK